MKRLPLYCSVLFLGVFAIGKLSPDYDPMQTVVHFSEAGIVCENDEQAWFFYVTNYVLTNLSSSRFVVITNDDHYEIRGLHRLP